MAEKPAKAEYPAAIAREKVGLSLEEAADCAGVSVGYLRRVERFQVACSYPLGMRLADLYGCNMNIFLMPPIGWEPKAKKSRAKKKPATRKKTVDPSGEQTES